MGKLSKPGGIRAERLDPNRYTQTLAGQAAAAGILTAGDMERLQAGLLELLAQQAAGWNKGKSSSLPAERAQVLMESILFVVGVALKAQGTPGQAAQALKQKPLDALFRQGLENVQRRVEALRRLHKSMVQQLFETPNIYYRAAAVEEPEDFFARYEPRFAAQELPVTADYPLCLGRPAGQGIEFMERYLGGLAAENGFCRLFAPEDVHHLLCGLTPDYAHIPLNLFEPVLLAALGLILNGRSPGRLDLTGPELDRLALLLAGRPAAELQKQLREALDQLARERGLPRYVRRYAIQCLPGLAGRVEAAAAGGTLDRVFLRPACPEKEPRLVSPAYMPMDSSHYRELVRAVLQTEDSAARAELLAGQIKTAADLEDILADGALTAAEVDGLLDGLPGSELARLFGRYPSGELLTGRSERLLYRALQRKRARLSAEEQRQLEQAIRALWKENALNE